MLQTIRLLVANSLGVQNCPDSLKKTSQALFEEHKVIKYLIKSLMRNL